MYIYGSASTASSESWMYSWPYDGSLPGLGNTVLTGIQRLDVGLGFEGGLGVVILAIILDRVTQSFGGQGRGRRRGIAARLRGLFRREASETKGS